MHKIKNKVQSLGLNQNILFPGFLEGIDKTSALMDADLFILTSFSESLPVSVLEAGASGTPIIITDCCDLAKDIHAKMGYMIPMDGNIAVKYIEKILYDENLMNKFSSNVKQHVYDNYNWDVITSKIEEVYHDLL